MRKRPLSDFPLALEFTASVAKNTKGKTVDFWRKELSKYDITGVCACGQCQTFYVRSSIHGKSYFNSGYLLEFYGKGGLHTTCVILHTDDYGRLNEIELPQITDVPFRDDYKHFMNANYHPKMQNPHLVQKTVKRWFRKNRVYAPFVIHVDTIDE